MMTASGSIVLCTNTPSTQSSTISSKGQDSEAMGRDPILQWKHMWGLALTRGFCRLNAQRAKIGILQLNPAGR